MNARNSKWMIAVAVAALGAVACNPYPAENTAAPRVDRVLAMGSGGPLVVENPGPYVMNNVQVGTPDPTTGIWGGLAFLVQFNKPMDGLTIQSYPNVDPSGNPWPPVGTPGAVEPFRTHECYPPANLTITPAGPVGTYYTCYYPSTPDTTSGSQLLFQTVPGTSRTSGSSFTGGVDYHITGTVKDLQGNPLAIDATFKVAVTPPAAPTLTPSTGSVAVAWTAVLNATSYDVQRAPNVPAGTPPVNASGTYANVATGLTAVTYTDTPVATGTYWYRIVAHGANGTVSNGGEAMVVVP